MRLQMCGVDHDPLRLAALARQRGENLVEHTQTAPANEPIVDRLVRAILSRRVTPAKPVLDHETRSHSRSAGRPPARSHANAENSARSGAFAPRKAETNQSWRSLLASPMNQPIQTCARNLIGPEPSGLGVLLAGLVQ